MSGQATKVIFKGLAPIPAGSSVTMLVDDPGGPKMAYSILDTTHGIKFSSSEPPKQRALKGRLRAEALPNFVSAQVISVVIYSLKNETELTVGDVRPVSEGALAATERK